MKTLLSVGIICAALLVSCSRGSKTQPNIPSTETIPDSSQSGAGSGQPPFDTGGLFDSNTGSDVTPAASPAPIPYKENDVFCLGRDSGLFGVRGVRGGFANEVNATAVSSEPTRSNVNASAASCLNPGAPSFGQSFFLDEALFSMGGMQSCFTFVAERRLPDGATAEEWLRHFNGAKRALVRCYRRILARQVQIAQWSNDSMGRYDQVDSHLFLLLSLFSQQN